MKSCPHPCPSPTLGIRTAAGSWGPLGCGGAGAMPSALPGAVAPPPAHLEGPLTSPYSPPAPGPDALGTSLCFPHGQQVLWTALLAGGRCPSSQATQLPHLPRRCPHCRLRDSVRLAWSPTGPRTHSHHHQNPGAFTPLLVGQKNRLAARSPNPD